MALVEVTTQRLAETISIAVIVCVALVVPYCSAALLWHRTNPRVRSTYRDPRTFYHPSLWFLTWLTRSNLAVIVIVLAIFFVRLSLRYEVVGEVTPQPFWSLALSGMASLVVVVALTLPATFLFTVKRWIETDQELDARGRLSSTEHEQAKERE